MATSSFEALIQSEKPVLIDFSAAWCGPCQMMAPILGQVKQTLGDKASIIKVDVDKNPALALQYQVQGVPTLILFKAGKMLWRQSGVLQPDQLTKIISLHI